MRTSEHEQYRRQLADSRGSDQAERFVSAAGTLLEQTEGLGRAFSEPAGVLYERACKIRDAADDLIDLAMELQ
jgi:hypothetical protein